MHMIRVRLALCVIARTDAFAESSELFESCVISCMYGYRPYRPHGVFITPIMASDDMSAICYCF